MRHQHPSLIVTREYKKEKNGQDTKLPITSVRTWATSDYLMRREPNIQSERSIVLRIALITSLFCLNALMLPVFHLRVHLYQNSKQAFLPILPVDQQL